MKFRLNLRKLILCLTILFILFFHANTSNAGKVKCTDVRDRGHLNVLTINLALFEIPRRDERLEHLVAFAKTQADEGEPIDIFLLQEGVAGDLVGTDGSPWDLQDKLRERGLFYDLETAQETAFDTGIAGILTTENAILSRCKIHSKMSNQLPTTSEKIEIVIGEEDPISITRDVMRNVMMVRIKIPGGAKHFHKVNVYNTHLCAGSGGSFVIGGITVNASGCTVEERENQLVSMLEFVKNTEQSFSFFRDKPHVLGGDFNIDNFRGADELALYYAITDTAAAGFIDAYAQSQMDNGVPIPLDELCVRSGVPFEPLPVRFPGILQGWKPDVHCTTGVSFWGSNGLFEEFFDTTPRRIDYVFQKGFGVGGGEVVFNPNASPPPPPPEPFAEPIVSDHAGVLVRILLQ